MSSPKNVFMIGWEYPPHNSGGLGEACQGITEALADDGAKITFTLPYQLDASVNHMDVVTCTDPSWLVDNPPDRPPFVAYSSELPAPHTVIPPKYDSHQLRALPQSELESKVDQYAQLVSDYGVNHPDQIDIIHAHDWMSFPAALKLSARTKAPLVAHVHSTEYDRIPHGYGSQYIMNTEHQGMVQADQVVAVSYYTKNLLIKKYGIDPAKIQVVHNGITPLDSLADSGRHHFAPARPVIVFMGRLTMQKGTEYFLQLASNVLKQMPEALFVVAGSGDMYHELLFSTARRHLSAHVVFSGFVRDHQKEKLLNRADVFVMPSLSEPFGLVALEAAQRNTPVIVSKNAGVAEVMPGSVSVDFWDIDQMTKQICQLIDNPTAAEAVIRQQHQDLQQVTWENSARKLAHVYRLAFLGQHKNKFQGSLPN